jgi:hypothetical protein
MEITKNLCHRCSSPLPEQALFCSECGSPQLVLTETDMERIEAERVAASDGSAPQPRASTLGRVRWRPVLRIVAGITLGIGVIAGVAIVVPPLNAAASLLTLFGPLLAIGLYQRTVPGAPMSGGVGARIGWVLGLLLSAMTVAVEAGSTLVARYGLHQGAQMDQEMNAALQQRYAQMMTAYASSSAPASDKAQFTQMMQTYMRFTQSPDGHAAQALSVAGFICACVVVYCTLSGALLGWLRSRQGLGTKN